MRRVFSIPAGIVGAGPTLRWVLLEFIKGIITVNFCLAPVVDYETSPKSRVRRNAGGALGRRFSVKQDTNTHAHARARTRTHTHTHKHEFQKLDIHSDSQNLFSLPCTHDTRLADGTHQNFPQLPLSHYDTKSSVPRQN
jgi:hypothetical protein